MRSSRIADESFVALVAEFCGFAGLAGFVGFAGFAGLRARGLCGVHEACGLAGLRDLLACMVRRARSGNRGRAVFLRLRGKFAGQRYA